MTFDRMASPDTDDEVDEQIAGFVDLSNPRSFFLFAGAGSGKTRSLVQAVHSALAGTRRRLEIARQSIAVITYTNAAADEIRRRIDFDPLVEVATIHSFAWKLIAPYQSDIREWLRADISTRLAEWQSKSSRAGSKAEEARQRRIARGNKRLASLDDIRRFVYSPTSDNRTRDSLNHSEVIAIVSQFLSSKPTLQSILVGRHPVLLVDESQDTNASLLDALLVTERANHERFMIGLFGDTMQRIYSDGKPDMESAVPSDWAKPVKEMNHRSPRRIVELANRIRSDVDEHLQSARSDSADGLVRLFVAPIDPDRVQEFESIVTARMREMTGDDLWTDVEGAPSVKKLILEHHMAARRLGFENLFAALLPLDRERTSLLDGSIGGLQVLMRDVVPLLAAANEADRFAVAQLVRQRSPLLSPESLKAHAGEGILTVAQAGVESLVGLWRNGSPSISEVSRSLQESGLFDNPEVIRAALDVGDVASAEDDIDSEIEAWRSCLDVSFDEVVAYASYVRGQSPFETHQGVKGLEFARVMVVVSDDEARGFMFSYDKLFGVKALGPADSGADSSVDRTRRLFYVTCTRAETSLAVLAYSSNPEQVRAYAQQREWFRDGEIEILS